jgi:asparagine synthase (glutamine-hydrolysing)
MQMVADVPIGAYLSGGVDSTMVVALMSQISPAPIKTFSLVYGQKNGKRDEDQYYARLAADKYKTDHYEYFLNPQEYMESVESIVESFDEPYSGVASTFFITKLISKHVKVALSGDGADELFGSYLPHRLARELAYCMRNNSKSDNPFINTLLSSGDEVEQRMGMHLYTDVQKNELLSPSMKAKILEKKSADIVREIYAKCGSSDPLNRSLFYDQKKLLPDQILAFVDRLSMASSVEVRPPFLDHRIIEYVSKIPPSLKINGNINKYILKKTASNLIPDEIINRKKEGFVLPTDEWFRVDLKDFVYDSLDSKKLLRHGLINKNYVCNLLTEHSCGKINNGPKILNLIMHTSNYMY